MLKDMDFGVYGKGIDGYVHYSLAMDRIRKEEENRKALMDEFDKDVDEMDEFDSDEEESSTRSCFGTLRTSIAKAPCAPARSL